MYFVQYYVIMAYWIIGRDGSTYGPTDLATLRRWVTEHRVVATTPVAESDGGPWHDASLVAGLASAFGEGLADPAPPTAPMPGAPPTSPVPSLLPAGWPPTAVTVPQLVSGIFNLIAAATWLVTCFGVILSVPLAILGIAELRAYAKASTTNPAEYAASTRTKAILSICAVLTGNFASAICGIVILTQLPDSDDPRLRG